MIFVLKAFVGLLLLAMLHFLLWSSFKYETVVCNMFLGNSSEDSKIPLSPDINNAVLGFDDLGKYHFPQDVLQVHSHRVQPLETNSTYVCSLIGSTIYRTGQCQCQPWVGICRYLLHGR